MGIMGNTLAYSIIEVVLKKNLGKFVPYLAIFEGIITAWIPGFLMLVDRW